MTTADAKLFEFEGVQVVAEWTEFGDRVKGFVILPSGQRAPWEVDRDGFSSISCYHEHVAKRTPADWKAIDRIFPVAADEPGRFRRATPAFVEAAWAASGVDRSGPAAGHEYTELDRLETLAACDVEGSPIRPAAKPKANRTCAECGSFVYGERCTHCHES
jgi:hypothetical protein